MCWKQEWAGAINNLNWAIIHVKRAQIKLQKRKLRNEKFLRHLKRSKSKSQKLITETQELLIKNSAGERECKSVITTLQLIQKELKVMIETYGIKHASNPAATRKLMGGRRKVKGKIKEWVDKY